MQYDSTLESTAEFGWHNIDNIDDADIPVDPKYYQWINNSYVLSRAYKKRCQNFSVEIIDVQEDAALLPDEISILKSATPKGFIRQVYLKGNDAPWSYGRITIPAQTLKDRADIFHNVGNKPFGEAVLYGCTNTLRGQMQFRLLTKDDNLFKAATKNPTIKADKLYARRSVFYFNDSPILVTEIYLPDIPDYR